MLCVRSANHLSYLWQTVWCHHGVAKATGAVMGCCHRNPSCCCEDCGGIFPGNGITCNMCTRILTCVRSQSHACSRRALRAVGTRDQNRYNAKDGHCCSRAPALLELLYQKRIRNLRELLCFKAVKRTHMGETR